jgi:serine/threonine protein kinase
MASAREHDLEDACDCRSHKLDVHHAIPVADCVHIVSVMADRYIKGQMLGKGSFGAAYLVTCKADGQKYVLKEIDISRMQRSEREGAEQEAKVSPDLASSL